jgi:hypothetical protein
LKVPDVVFVDQTQCPGVWLCPLVPGDINTGTWLSRFGGISKIEIIKYSLCLEGLRPKRDCAGEAKQ